MGNVKSQLIYDQLLLNLLKDGKDKELQETIIRNGFLSNNDNGYNSDEKQLLQQIHKEFWKEFTNLSKIHNVEQYNFIIKIAQFSRETKSKLIQYHLTNCSLEWINDVTIPLVDGHKSLYEVSLFNSHFVNCLLYREDIEIIDACSKFVSWHNINFDIAKNTNQLKIIIDYKKKNNKVKGKYPYQEFKKDLENYFNSKIINNRNESNRIYSWQNEYNYLKSMIEIEKDDFEIEYLLLKNLIKQDKVGKKILNDTSSLIEFLAVNDNSFTQNIKYMAKSMPEINKIKSKIELNKKLTNILTPQTNNNVIRRQKI